MSQIPQESQVLNDRDLAARAPFLLGIGQIRRAFVGEGPSTAKDLERVSRNSLAIGELALLLARLESDGNVYTHRRDVYLNVTPKRELFRINCRALEDFEQIVQDFQCWIDARQHMVATGSQLAAAMTPIKQRAGRALDSVEAAASSGLLNAYKHWLKTWARAEQTKYSIFLVGRKPVALRVPPLATLFPKVQVAEKPHLGLAECEAVVKVVRMQLVRTVTGRTLLIEDGNDATHLMPGHSIQFRLPVNGQVKALPLHSMARSRETSVDSEMRISTGGRHA